MAFEKSKMLKFNYDMFEIHVSNMLVENFKKKNINYLL